MSPSPGLTSLLAGLEQVTVVRGPYVDPAAAAAVLPDGVAGRVTRLDLTALPPVAWSGPHDAVVLVVADRAALRSVVGACRGLPASTRLSCVLLAGGEPPLPVGRPLWPATVSLTARSGPTCFTLLELAGPLPAGELVAELARRCSPRHLMSTGWPVLGVAASAPDSWPPGDSAAIVGTAEQVADTSGDYPADLVLTDVATAPGSPDPVRPSDHPVLGPLPGALLVPPSLSWQEHADLDPVAAEHRLAAGGLGPGGVDDAVLNPAGFVRRPREPLRPLCPVTTAPWLLEVLTDAGPVVVDSRRGLGERDVERLRGLRGVQLSWQGGHGPRDHCRVVAGLSMAGVPLVADPAPGWARALLDHDLLDLVEAADEAMLADPFERELHSIRVRRLALDRHSARAWRREVAARAGLQHASRPTVSVLLATRRPERVGFALRQVARQRGVRVQVVLACHGHQPGPHAGLAGGLGEAGTGVSDLVRLDVPSATTFGDLLNQAAAAADGDLLLKMDDDDWYGPGFVSDLLLAREHSGADVVGTPPEFVYVEPLGVTVRRKDVSERFRSVVAGGTMLLGPETLRAVGGFRRMRRHVDAGLLQAVVAAGGSVYRAHGHGYLLRRTGQGHTWDPGLGYFVARSRTAAQWRGFRPSPLLEVDPRDLPVGSAVRQPEPPSGVPAAAVSGPPGTVTE
ncbi:MAG: glycosyltransferase [Nocardioidaceae bacterium]